jgi:hypothetical protein
MADTEGEQVGLPRQSRSLGDTATAGLQSRAWKADDAERQFRSVIAARHWDDCDWLACTDGKARPTQSGTFPLAHGVSARVGRLRAYGNAIVPQVAAEFIKAFIA